MLILMVKRLVIYSLFFFGFLAVKAQIPVADNGDQTNSDTIPSGTFEPASFPGGMEKFYTYVINTIRMPRDDRGINGKVYVQFVIDSTGIILSEDIRVIKSLSKSCDAEAIRLIKNSPRWIPARENGHPIRHTMVMPISFIYP